MQASALVVTVVPCLADNYAYLVRRPGERAAAVVDPGDAGAVLRAARAQDVDLVAVLSTHHHTDHVGGNAELQRARPALRVFGAAVGAGRIPVLTDPLPPGARVTIAGLELEALAVPGHTRDGLAFAGHGWVFTGDTLFGAGCGRLFEGTAAELLASLRRIARLPPATRVAFGHEYTAQNLRFAAQLEPGLRALAARAAAVVARRLGAPDVTSTWPTSSKPTLPAHEQPTLRAALGVGAERSDEDVFALVRALKDRSASACSRVLIGASPSSPGSPGRRCS